MPGMRQIHTFKAGTHTTASGQQVTITAADLQASAAAYDPALSEAPLVVGHPTNDGPAYGWVQSVRAEGNDLVAVPHQVNTEFNELVQAGAYKKVSAAFYAPQHPRNPKPGTYYLRHIGFLGAQPPAIKGLRGPEFSDADASAADLVVLEVDFSEGAVGAPANPQDPGAPTGETMDPAQDLKAQLAAVTAERDAAKAQLTAAAAAANTAAHTAFAETLVAGAKVPREKLPLVVALLDFAEPPADTGAQVVEFGEGAAKAPLAKHLKDFLSGLPAQVAFSEQASKDKAADKTNGDERRTKLLAKARLEFGEAADQARLERHVDVTLYAEEHKLSYADALRDMQAKA
jgi:hypothetical protein